MLSGERVVLSREGKGGRVAGIWIEGKKPAALVVNAGGADAARRSEEVTREVIMGRLLSSRSR